MRALGRVGMAVALAWAAVGVAAGAQPTPAGGAEDCSGYPCLMSFAELDAWSPSSVDPRQRASVPLAPRAGTATPKVVVGLDLTDFNYHPDADGSTQGGPIDNLYAFGHWQQTDIAYYFRHSLVSVPPVVWTNAAHRNGVPVLGVIEADFKPDGGDRFDELFTEANVERTTEQLAAMATAYGFDGWLFDPENGATPNEHMVASIASLRAQGFVVGYYEAGVCSLTDTTSSVTLDAAQAATFWQGDYPCLGVGKPEQTYDWITAHGGLLDRWDAYNASSLYASEVTGEAPPCGPGEVSNGLACNRLGRWEEPATDTFLGGLALAISPEAPGGAWGSLAVYAPAWPAYGGSKGFPAEVPVDVWRPLDDRIWGGSTPPVGPDCSTAASDGLARWAPPRPPVTALPFTTTLNRGFGPSFSVLGTPVSGRGWNHIGMEDALPSWLCRTAGEPGQVEAALVDGPTWNGATALALTGSLPAGGEAAWGVWAAALDVPAGAGGDEPVAVLRTAGTGPAPWLSLRFADGGTERVALEPLPADGTGWVSAEASLAPFAGRTITRVGVGVGGEGTDAAPVDQRVGGLTLARRQQLQPLDVVAVPVGDSLTIAWEQPAGAVSANVWAQLGSGCATFLGPTYVLTYDVADALFPLPVGAEVTGFTAQPVTAAGTAAPLGVPVCGHVPPVPPVPPPPPGPGPGPTPVVAPRFTG